MKKRIIVGIFFGLFIVGFNLAAESRVIPFDEWRYNSEALTFLYGFINLPIIFVQAITGVRSLGLIMVMFFVWWFIVGYVATWIGQWIVIRASRT